MSTRCTICTHKEHAAIDASLVVGEPHRTIAARYGLSKASVTRHMQHARPVAIAIAETGAAHERTVLEKVRALIGDTQAIFDAVKGQSYEVGPIEAARELGRLFELEGKLTGAFAPKLVKHIDAREMTVEEQLEDVRRLEKEIVAERARLEAEAGGTLQ